MPRLRLVMLLAVLAAPLAAAEPPFPTSVLQSVVTVLPLRGPEAPKRAPGDVRTEEVSGSGVAIRSGGYVATNAHVVDRAQRIFVRLSDGRERPAEIVARDAATDIALLRIEMDLAPLPLGGEPAPGARVCSVSDPFGVGLSVTCGVVSAVRRSGMGFNPVEDFIQTDAVLNPGSSGGALVNETGELVGLVAAIFTRSADANIGINFAISAALVKRVVDDLIAHGRVVAGQAGWRLVPLSRAARRDLAGLRVAALQPGGAAEAAGVRLGDVVTAVDGRSVRKPSDAVTALYLRRPGDRIAVEILRGGAEQTVMLTIAR